MDGDLLKYGHLSTVPQRTNGAVSLSSYFRLTDHLAGNFTSPGRWRRLARMRPLRVDKVADGYDRPTLCEPIVPPVGTA
jgi:hypothetical protein